MLHVTAIIRVQSGHMPEVAAALKELAQRSRHERGCRGYDVLRCDETTLFTREIWADAAAEAAHLQGAHVAAAVAAVGHLLAGPLEIHRGTPLG